MVLCHSMNTGAVVGAFKPHAPHRSILFGGKTLRRCKKTLQWRIQDFSELGALTLQGVRQHMILPKFPKNCMKLKEFGPGGGGARPSRPL